MHPSVGGTRGVLEWLRARDAGLSALRRATRAAIVMPGMFALGSQVIGNSTVATFAAFGSFALLLLADFGGTMPERLAAQVSLIASGCVLICLGTLASRNAWLAAAAMVVVGFLVLFSGVVSSVLAAASTSVLLSFILPVSLPGPIGSIPDRLAGWLLAGAASLIAISLLWPAPVREPLRTAAAEACRRLSMRLTAEVSADGDSLADTSFADTVAAADASVAALRTTFFATPYRPTGLSTAARAIVRLVDEIIWLSVILSHMPMGRSSPFEETVRAVKTAAATLLDHAGKALGPGRGPEDSLQAHLSDLARARADMERAATGSLPLKRTADGATELVSSLEPSFRAHELTFAITAIAENIEVTLAAQQRTWWQKLLGRSPKGVDGALASAQQRAGAHVERHSVWLHNSVRGAVGLGGAVLIADLSGAQHSFWIVLGTLSVLRSNALNTGQNVVRGLLGTALGFVVGGLLVAAIGTNTTLLWFLLPVAIVVAGIAPAVSFAAGQAGFTVTLLILFNILSPTGWQVGLVRIEDVAIGFAVSLVVGTLFWPRGAAAALAQALFEAYTECAGYLRAAVEWGAQRCASTPPGRPPGDEAVRAAAAARRLDDAFRGFLAEPGTKHLALAEVAALITGVAGLRLTADAVLDLWLNCEESPAADRTAAQAELVAVGGRVSEWYRTMAQAVVAGGTVPEPLPHDAAADGRLVGAVRHDLLDGVDGGRPLAVRIIWTGDHLDAVRRLQDSLAQPSREAAAYRHRSRRLTPWRGVPVG
jgi:uncharacterized membrane protein YccC